MNNTTIFFEYIREEFKTHKIVNKNDIIKKMPKNLLTEAKREKLDTYKDNISEKTFVNFLRYKQYYADYVNFDYIIGYYKLKTDKNHMIVFTDKFPFDNRIKKEALFIWSILNMIKNDEILKNFQQYINKDLQTKFTLNLLDNNMGSKFDLCFKELRIAIEIDENHTNNQILINDGNKSSMLKLNGYNLTRLDFQNINIGPTIIGNINDIMYNNQYYGDFLNELKEKILASLLHKYVDVREWYILDMYKKSINEKISELNSYVADNLKYIKIYTNICKTTNNSVIYAENYTKIKNSKLEIEYDNTSLDVYKKILSEINSNSGEKNEFNILFELKNKCKEYNYSNVITFEEITTLLQTIENDYSKLRNILRKNSIIYKCDLDYNLIRITWKQLSIVISNYFKAEHLQKILMTYYIEIEESYEKIINMINKHNESISGSEIDYKLSMNYIIDKNSESHEKKFDKLNTLNKKLKQKLLFEIDINESYKKQLKPVILGPPIDHSKMYKEMPEINLKQLKVKIDEINAETDNLDTPEEFAQKHGLTPIKNGATDSSDYDSDGRYSELSDDDF